MVILVSDDHGMKRCQRINALKQADRWAPERAVVSSSSAPSPIRRE
jgi:hypothetical protein